MAKKSIRYVALLVLVLALAVVGFILAVNFDFFGHLYSRSELRAFQNQTATRIFSRDGALIGQFFDENRTNVRFSEIPPFVIDALIATEDARYFSHEGVDSRSLLRVLFKSILLSDSSSGGGSTITQQLVKNMYGRANFGPLSMLVNKTKEVLLARRIESIYTKEEILALYLNTIPFGENVFGIESASRLFFNKSVSQLRIDEGAVLIGMLKANTYYNPRSYPKHAFVRRNVVFEQMRKYGYISVAQSDSLKLVPIILEYANLESVGPANYFLVEVKQDLSEILDSIAQKTGTKYNFKTDGLVVTTTLDNELQQFALRAFKAHLSVMQQKLRHQYTSGSSSVTLHKLVQKELKRLSGLEKPEGRPLEIFSWEGNYVDSISEEERIRLLLTTLQAGLLAIQPQNGDILVWVGGIDFRTQPFDQILAKRQLASTFKPFLYAAALETGMSPCDYLSNEPKVYIDLNNWKPSNYDHSVGGYYSLAGALSKSMNVPSVDLLSHVGFEEVDDVWRKLGFSYDLENTPSLALGTGEASLYELAQAYASFANGGYAVIPRTILEIKNAEGEVIYAAQKPSRSKPILTSRTSVLMNAMLQKVIDEGTGNAIRNTYGVKMPLAGKTGTSQNYVDAWFVGYSPKIVLVTRVGASNPAIHFTTGVYGSGGKLALPIVGLILKQIEDSVIKSYSSNFAPLSDSLALQMDCVDYRDETRLERFFGVFESEKTTIQKETKKREAKSDKKKKRKRKIDIGRK